MVQRRDRSGGLTQHWLEAKERRWRGRLGVGEKIGGTSGNGRQGKVLGERTGNHSLVRQSATYCLTRYSW